MSVNGKPNAHSWGGAQSSQACDPFGSSGHFVFAFVAPVRVAPLAAIGPESVNQGMKAIIIARGNVSEDGFDFIGACGCFLRTTAFACAHFPVTRLCSIRSSASDGRFAPLLPAGVPSRRLPYTSPLPARLLALQCAPIR